MLSLFIIFWSFVEIYSIFLVSFLLAILLSIFFLLPSISSNSWSWVISISFLLSNHTRFKDCFREMFSNKSHCSISVLIEYIGIVIRVGSELNYLYWLGCARVHLPWYYCWLLVCTHSLLLYQVWFIAPLYFYLVYCFKLLGWDTCF